MISKVVSNDFCNTVLVWNSRSGDIVDFYVDARYFVGAYGPRVYVWDAESEIGTVVEEQIYLVEHEYTIRSIGRAAVYSSPVGITSMYLGSRPNAPKL